MYRPAKRKALEPYFTIFRFHSNAVEDVWCKMLRDFDFFKYNHNSSALTVII